MKTEAYSLSFTQAAKNGHLNVLNYLDSIVSNRQLQDMIAANNYAAFCEAAASGHLNVLNYLEYKAPKQLPAMIDQLQTIIKQKKWINWEMGILQYLESKVSNSQLQAMIAANNYAAFRKLAEKQELHALHYLESKVSNRKLQAMIAADDYSAFLSAAEKGNIEILEYFISKASEQLLQDMIAANDYAAFTMAAQNGHLSILRCLESKLQTLDKLQDAILNPKNNVLWVVNLYGHTNRNVLYQNVLHLLLHYPAIFAHAEKKYPSCIPRFVTQAIQDLQTQQRRLKAQNPKTEFDIPEAKKSQLYFYILRNLLNRNDPSLRDNILFLLGIPSVNALVHREVTPAQSNEPFRLNNYYSRGMVSIESLPNVFLLMKQKNNTIDFSNLPLGKATFQQFLAVLQAIPEFVTHIDFHGTNLEQLKRLPAEMNEANIEEFIRPLPNIEIAYFSQSEFEKMSDIQRKAVIHLFPNIQYPIFINDQGVPLSSKTSQTKGASLVSNINYARKMGFEVPLPSLQIQAAFFFAKNYKQVDTASMPLSIQLPLKKIS